MSDRITPSDLPYAGSIPKGMGFCKGTNGNLLWDGGSSIDSLNSASSSQSQLLAIGDSITQFAKRGWKSLNGTYDYGLQPLYVVGTSLTTDAACTVEYSFALKSFRWTAPGDTAGPWVLASVGILQLESGSADKAMLLGVRSLSQLTTDRTLSLSTTSSLDFGYRNDGYLNRFLTRLFQPFGEVFNVGIGSLTAAEAADPLFRNYYKSAMSGDGMFTVYLGSNDITADTDTALTIWFNVKAVIDDQLNMGRSGLIFGLHARTLTASQLSKTIAFNAYAKAYAETMPSRLRFVDTYSTVVDKTAITGVNMANTLADTVHLSKLGADMVALKAIEASSGLIVAGSPSIVGDPNNLIKAFGYMTGGDTAEVGAGASGNYPAGWSGCERSYGAAATSVSSVINSTNGNFRAWQIVVSSASDSNVIDARGPASTLAALGVAVGDTIRAEIDFFATGLANVIINMFLLQTGGTSRYLDSNFEFNGARSVTYGHAATDSGKLVTPEFTIPSGATNIRMYVRVQCGAGATGTIELANAAIFKVV